MTNRQKELEEICSIVIQDPTNIPQETRKRFWKLVRQIKKNPQPDHEEVVKAAEIRDILFEVDRGRTFRIAPIVAFETILGIIGPVLFYLWLLGYSLEWSIFPSWTIQEWFNFSLRFASVMGAVFLFYPWGRIIAGKWTGIKFDGMCRDEFYEPTLKINYVSFLMTPAPKRKWFFFFSGMWTVITSILVGALGFLFARDLTGFIPAGLLFMLYIYVLASGGTKHMNGELGHYNREKKIEKVWKRKLAELEKHEFSM